MFSPEKEISFACSLEEKEIFVRFFEGKEIFVSSI